MVIREVQLYYTQGIPVAESLQTEAVIPTSEGFAIVMTAPDNLRKPGKLPSGMTSFDEPQTTLKLISLSTGGRAPLQHFSKKLVIVQCNWPLCKGCVWAPMPGL